ncbi:hypothetical protein HYV64_01750 [Candidatus Shapirobacteria bacterium]|nr:hypothetical protein [Candidatus Shapirobacteria bacterium]
MTKFGTIVLTLVMLLTSTSVAFASGFHLKLIGNADTGGRQISHWWYSSSKPVFSGEAMPGAAVVFDIDGSALEINADSSGNWNFAAQEPLSDGDHQITITSDGSTIKFTLTIGNGNVNWDSVQNGSSETLPTVGTSLPTILLFITGVAGLSWGGKMILNVSKE